MFYDNLMIFSPDKTSNMSKVDTYRAALNTCPAMVHMRLQPNAYSKFAIARISGGPLAPWLNGIIVFKPVQGGTEVCADITGLPPYQPGKDGKPPIGPHGFHIHENGNCEIGDPQNPFMAAGGHWNPTNQPHGNHAGDFPVLFSNSGQARMCFFSDKFIVQDIIGKAVVIHQSPDDYRTQPAGDAGKRLGCGVIEWAGCINPPQRLYL